MIVKISIGDLKKMSSKQEQKSTSNTSQEPTLFKEIHHIGIVVQDIEKTAEFFTEKLGIPFTIRTMEHSGTIHDEPMKYKAKIAQAKIGSQTLELLQTIEGKTIFEEYLNKKGEGIHHLAVAASGELNAEIEKWQKLGIKALQIDQTNPGEGTAYMDVQGCIIEILCFKRMR